MINTLPSGIGRRMRRLLLLLALLASMPAGGTTLLAELDTSSPAATLRSFLAEQPRVEALFSAYQESPTTARQRALAEVLLRVGAELFDLRELPPATRDKAGAAAAGYLADILARLPEIPLGTVPGDPDWQGATLPAHWTIPGTEIRIVKLADGPRAGDYVFSAATVARLPGFHARIADQPVLRANGVGDWVARQHRITGPWLVPLGLDSLPSYLQVGILDTPIWKAAIAMGVGVAIWVITLSWRRFVLRRAGRLNPWRFRALMLTVPALLALLVLAGHIFITWQVVPANAFAVAETTIAVALLYLAAATGVWHACWLIAELVIASPAFPDSTYDAHLVRIVARVGSLLTAVLVILYGLNDIGVPALGLLAGASIGGVALALAAQSTAANLLGGISIFADRPFRIGDVIRHGTNSGTVEAIGPRSTRIRGADGTLTTVPNADLANAQLVNISARPSSLFHHRFGLPAGMASERIEALLAELRRRVAAHPLVERGPGKPRVRLTGLGTAGGTAEVEIFAHLATTATPEFLEAQEELLLDILRSVENGVAQRDAAAMMQTAP